MGRTRVGTMSKSIKTEYTVIVDVEGDVGVEGEGRGRTKSERRDQTVSWGQTVAGICQTRAYKLYTKN